MPIFGAPKKWDKMQHLQIFVL